MTLQTCFPPKCTHKTLTENTVRPLSGRQIGDQARLGAVIGRKSDAKNEGDRGRRSGTRRASVVDRRGGARWRIESRIRKRRRQQMWRRVQIRALYRRGRRFRDGGVHAAVVRRGPNRGPIGRLRCLFAVSPGRVMSGDCRRRRIADSSTHGARHRQRGQDDQHESADLLSPIHHSSITRRNGGPITAERVSA